ncbi:hypothetical protein BKA81DRAFT_375646 [Phyllosticta paracitricarpa]
MCSGSFHAREAKRWKPWGRLPVLTVRTILRGTLLFLSFAAAPHYDQIREASRGDEPSGSAANSYHFHPSNFLAKNGSPGRSAKQALVPVHNTMVPTCPVPFRPMIRRLSLATQRKQGPAQHMQHEDLPLWALAREVLGEGRLE